MRALLPFLVAFSLSCAGAAEERESVTFSAKAAGHTIHAVLSSRYFDAKQHQIVLPTRGSNEQGRIDGRIPIGADAAAKPFVEFSRFEVRWDGKPVTIPASLYADCFEPHLIRKEGYWDEKGSVYFLPSQDGSSLLIQMHGSDAGGGYFVTWLISRSGRHVRFIDQDVP